MYWIDDPITTSGSTPPTPGAATNPIGWFTEGDEETGAPPTPVHADWLNGIQGEALNLLAAAGVTASKTVFTQWAQSVKRIAGGNSSAFSANGTLTADNAGLVLVNATSGNLTIGLAPAEGAGTQVFRIRRVDLTSHTVSLTLAGSDTWMPGSTTGTLVLQQGEEVDLYSDGVSTWFVVPLRWGRRFAIITTSGTFAVPLATGTLDIEAWGAGAGSFASVSGIAAGGSGAGAYGRLRASGQTPLASLTATIGAGGTAGTTAPASPGNGGSTSLGALITAAGGVFNPLNSTSAPTWGGLGGACSGGDINIVGGCGLEGVGNQGGAGGAAPCGGGLLGGGGGAGIAGNFPGGGAAGAGTGAGSTTPNNGAAGAGGLIVVRW